MRLDLGHPIGLVREDQRHLGALARPELWHGLKLARHLPRFHAALIQNAVGAVQARMHLFLRKGGLPPAEIGHQFRAMREGLPSPGADHSGNRRGIIGRPIHRPRLLFHHPPTPPTTGSVEIMVKAGDVGMALTHIGEFLLVGPAEHLKEAEWIGIPCGDI